MDVSILSTFDNQGGAAIAARRLCDGLRLLNHDSYMIVRDREIESPYILNVQSENLEHKMEKKIFQSIQNNSIDAHRTELSNTWFSFPYPGYDLSKSMVIKKSDIINLHWIIGLQTIEHIAALLKMNKPVVWTLHDENPFTGGCHYTAGCRKYQTDCFDCPQLTKNHYQIPFHVLENKADLWNKNFTIVSPSRWLAEQAKGSRLFKNLRIEVIPNSVETEIFFPQEKALAKKSLGLDPDIRTLLFGTHISTEKRKGFFKLVEAMKYCLKDEKFKNLAISEKVKVLTFGPPQQDLEDLDVKIESLGFINDFKELSTVYSAADIFILPSLEDNLPNTMLEAMACGTPVIGFEVGGLPDMIQNGVTGYLAPCFDSQKIGDLIVKLIFNKKERKRLSLNSRQLIAEKYKLGDQAKKYLHLFNDLLKHRDTRNCHEEGKKISFEKGTIILNERGFGIQKELIGIYRDHGLKILTELHSRYKRLQQKIEQKESEKEHFGHQLRIEPRLLQKNEEIKNLKSKIAQKDAEIETLNDQINQKDDKISELYKSYSYGIGHLILFPIKKMRLLYWKIRKFIKN